MPRVRVDNLEIDYKVAYRHIRYPRLELRTGELLVVLPKKGRSAKAVIEKHRQWIVAKKAAINTALLKADNKHLVMTRSNEVLKKLVLASMKKFASACGFQVGKTYFRKMKSKWASHSGNNNLTINTDMRYLPKSVIDYVVFHEMAHSLERRHNTRFWKIVGRKFPNHQKKESELGTYWFLMQKI